VWPVEHLPYELARSSMERFPREVLPAWHALEPVASPTAG
jgi:hypothetical protein